MKIISLKICPFVQRVTALLEMKGADYALEYIDLSDKPQWFLDISPHAQVPILVTDDGAVLFESDAIAEYVEETVGDPLAAADPVRRAQDRAWSSLATKHYLAQCSAQRSPSHDALAERIAPLAAAFAKFEAHLPTGAFVNGDRPGMVDIAWLPLLHRAAIIEKRADYDFIAGFPKLKSLQHNLLVTGIAEKSVAPDFEEVFADFYLSDATFLGQSMAEATVGLRATDGPLRVSDGACVG